IATDEPSVFSTLGFGILNLNDPSGPTVVLLVKSVSSSLSTITVPSICTNSDRKSTRLNSSHVSISYAVFCLKKKISKTMRSLNRLRLKKLTRWLKKRTKKLKNLTKLQRTPQRKNQHRHVTQIINSPDL